jgi:hypothetical protein
MSNGHRAVVHGARKPVDVAVAPKLVLKDPTKAVLQHVNASSIRVEEYKGPRQVYEEGMIQRVNGHVRQGDISAEDAQKLLRANRQEKDRMNHNLDVLSEALAGSDLRRITQPKKKIPMVSLKTFCIVF